MYLRVITRIYEDDSELQDSRVRDGSVEGDEGDAGLRSRQQTATPRSAVIILNHG